MGRPSRKLTPKELEEIESMAGIGLTQQQIADIKGMDVDTLRKHAGAIIKRGKSKAIGKISQTAYNMAASGEHPSMTRFWLKMQAGWHESVPDEIMTLLGEVTNVEIEEDEKA